MKKKHYIISSWFLLLVVIIFIIIKIFSNNSCQTEEIQTNQKEPPEKEKISLSPEEYFILPFMIIHNENGQRMLKYEEAFLQNVEKIKKAHLQRNVITEYITNTSNQKKFLSEVEETSFYELSTEEKVKILDANTIDKPYRFGDDLARMEGRKLYRFWEFQLALCGEYFWAWISCVNNLYDPFQIVAQNNDNVFTGILIRKIWETQRYSLRIPQVGNFPVSIWIKNGRLFLILHVTQNGEYSPSIHDWNGAIYTLEKMRWEKTEEYNRVFQQCYDTAYKGVSWEYILWDNSPLSWSFLWDNWLFMEDTLISPRNCFSEKS